MPGADEMTETARRLVERSPPLAFPYRTPMHALRTAVRRSHTPIAFARRPLKSSFRFYSTAPRTCPSCSAPLQSSLPTCLKCSYIAPLPSDTTYFDMLDASNTQNLFKVDLGSLRRKFLDAQRVCHPDAWSGKGEVWNYSKMSNCSDVFSRDRKPLQLHSPLL